MKTRLSLAKSDANHDFENYSVLKPLAPDAPQFQIDHPP